MGTKKKNNWLLSGNGCLSPFSNVPWASIIALALWLLVVTTGPANASDASSLGKGWIVAVALVAYAYYAYKIAENVYVAFYPTKWWIMPYLHRTQRSQMTRRSASLLDGVDLLFVAAWATNGLIFYAFVVIFPDGLPALDPVTPIGYALIRVSSMIAFSGFGTGFTTLVPVGPAAELLAWFLTAVQLFTSAIVVSNLVAVAASGRSGVVAEDE